MQTDGRTPQDAVSVGTSQDADCTGAQRVGTGALSRANSEKPCAVSAYAEGRVSEGKGKRKRRFPELERRDRLIARIDDIVSRVIRSRLDHGRLLDYLAEVFSSDDWKRLTQRNREYVAGYIQGRLTDINRAMVWVLWDTVRGRYMHNAHDVSNVIGSDGIVRTGLAYKVSNDDSEELTCSWCDVGTGAHYWPITLPTIGGYWTQYGPDGMSADSWMRRTTRDDNGRSFVWSESEERKHSK